MPTRRDILFGGAVAPAMLHSATAPRAYKWAEIQKMIDSGNLHDSLTRADLPTPALLLDLDAFEANVAKMTQHAKRKGLALRPHGKTHKCPEIAKRLVKAGATGTCAAKISEAEAFAANGVDNLLVTTAVIGKYKIERGVRLAASTPGTILCVDDPQNVRDLNDAAGVAGIKLSLAVDLMVGNRTGVPTGEQALKLAQLIDSLPNVRLKGMQSYVGFAAHVNGFEARKKRSMEAMGPAVETRRMVEKSGVQCGWLSGASTGTYNIDCDIDGVTELQPGSFIFMDMDYNRIGGKDGPEYHDFQNSLTVLTTVVSAPEKNRVVVDGGLKAFSTDRKFGPIAKDVEGLGYSWGGDEHGQLDLSDVSEEIKLGDKVEFIVPHCDPTVNLYDQIFCLRGDNVESVWQIAARGRSQ
jgi:D-serine deaminase-like pyridoxal phosphate-dependent protein